MLERRTRTIQKKIKAAGEEILSVQKAIGELLEGPIAPGDAGVAFRCRLLLNRCTAIDEELSSLIESLPERSGTAVSRSLAAQNRQLLLLQKNTLNSLLDSMKKSGNALETAKKMELEAESLRIGERIRKKC